MKHIRAILNGRLVKLNVPESLGEFKEGARLSGGLLTDDEGYLFKFNKSTHILMENSGVHHDLALLYFHDLTGKYGIVQEVQYMKGNCGEVVRSTGVFSVVVELRKDFVKQNRIEKGTILCLKEELKIEKP